MPGYQKRMHEGFMQVSAPKGAKYTTVNNQGLCAGVANRMSNSRLDPLHITINDVRIHYINQS